MSECFHIIAYHSRIFLRPLGGEAIRLTFILRHFRSLALKWLAAERLIIAALPLSVGGVPFGRRPFDRVSRRSRSRGAFPAAPAPTPTPREMHSN